MDIIKKFWAQHRGAIVTIACLAVSFGLALHQHAVGGAAVPVGMAAVSVTNILAGTNTYIGDVIATADGDTTATITHGLSAGGTPLGLSATQLLSQALTALSAWAFAAPGATTCVGTKLASTGSGNASAQVRVMISGPHSIVR